MLSGIVSERIWPIHTPPTEAISCDQPPGQNDIRSVGELPSEKYAKTRNRNQVHGGVSVVIMNGTIRLISEAAAGLVHAASDCSDYKRHNAPAW